MRLADHEKEIRIRLKNANIDSPDLCARLLTAHVAGLDKISYCMARDQELPASMAILLSRLAGRRERGEPLAYILGEKEFYGRPFSVNSHTLIPRPETELLIDLALANLSGNNLLFADPGCGSGCIGLTLMLERPDWHGLLFDNKKGAISMAAANAASYGLKPDIILADMFASPLGMDCLDLIISNPPYISPREKKDVMPEVLAYEPENALFSSENGLGHLAAVIRLARYSLKHGGMLIMEHGYQQANDVANLLFAYGFRNMNAHKDLAGLARCVTAIKDGG